MTRAELPRGVHLSIRAFCEEAGTDRDTTSRRVTEARCRPTGQRGGHPVYRLQDLLRASFFTGADGDADPDKLDPFKRRAFYQGELDKLKLGVERGELVPRIEVEQEQARTMKIVARFFDTLPDVLERDCGASPILLAKVEQRLDEVREEIYRELVAEDVDSAVA
jgi:hypothetical protein